MNTPQPIKTQIAIIGVAGRFPACDDVSAFWDCLKQGRSGVKSIQPNTSSRLPLDSNYVPMAATVEQADCFDASFFGILPRMAQEMDPQHRLFLEICWSALEDAGYRPDATQDRVGVFAGCHMNTYIFLRLAADAALRATLADSFPGGNLNAEILNDKDYLATRVAYHLNLRGPAVAIQTACSTSLVAIAQACQSLEAGDCDMALAGGSCITFPQDQGYLHTEDSILSPDGMCRTFDADAKGTIFADGVGAVVLKPLESAQRDGDSIYAVIEGWGVNNDGGIKGGYTAPSVSGQVGAILQAHKKAGISAETISYVEAHGTGTLVGDPIEIAALTEAFRNSTSRNQYCAIGSLKSNFGHLDVAAGVAAIIKTALALHHRQLPPNLHFSKPNPRIKFSESPFYVQTQLTEWSEPRIDGNPVPRRAGVSSFGVGGTNAHLVLQEFVQSPTTVADQVSPALFCLSANTPQSLKRVCQAIADRLEHGPLVNLHDASFTLMAGRKPCAYRFTAVGCKKEEFVAQLRSVQAVAQAPSKTKVLFLFPGQGSQHVGMAAELYRGDRRFAKHLDQAAEALKPHTGLDLRLLALGQDQQSSRIDETAFAQPAIFMVSYALARWLQDMGIEPDYVMGHSVGEFAAATVAGVMSLADGARLVAARGALMQRLSSGSMLAITADPSQLSAILTEGVEIAALNAPALNVVSGPTDKIMALSHEIESGKFGDEITARLLRTSHAFHSAMMDAAIQPFGDIVAQCNLQPTVGIDMVSTVTGTKLSADQATSNEYWANQIRLPVMFSKSIAGILADQPNLTMIEVGPSQALTALVRQHSLNPETQSVIPLLPHAKEGDRCHQFAVAAIGKIWQAGIPLDATRFFSSVDSRHRVHLPTYSFERSRHWFQISESNLPAESTIDQPIDQTIGPMDEIDEKMTSAQLVRTAAQSGLSIGESAPSCFELELIQSQLRIMNRQIELLEQHDGRI